MTTKSVDLSIQAEVKFPAAEIQLLPLPPEPGVYLLADTGLAKLEVAEIDNQKVSGSWYSSEQKHFCTGEGSVSTPHGKLRFIDTSPATMLPARTGGYGLVLHEDGDKTPYNGVFKDSKEYFGDEMLVVRSIDAEPGNYAFVTFSEKDRHGLQLDDSAGCLPFKVQ